MTVVIGVKAGQRHEPSGLCAAEIVERGGGAFAEVHFAARYLERLPAGTRFPAIAERVGELVLGLWKRHATCSRIYLDATGHGQPLVDLFRQHARFGQGHARHPRRPPFRSRLTARVVESKLRRTYASAWKLRGH